MLEYLNRERFGSKIARSKRKEAQAIFEPNLFPYKYSSILKSSHSSSLSTYEDGTQCTEMLAYKIQTPENYPDESIWHSEHDESSKSRMSVFTASYRVSNNLQLRSVLNPHDTVRRNFRQYVL